MGLTIYGAEADESALFRAMAARSDVLPTITAAPVSEANAALAFGNDCVSVSHKTPVTNGVLRALHAAGVRYLSTRSVGCNHINVGYAERLGIAVEPVAYSPDSVADYTMLLILMALRNTLSIVRRVDQHDYRLPAVRGRELRDLTVGVVGAGRIGSAVIARLRAFGGTVLAHDRRPKVPADYLSLEALLLRSDIVTLHVPLDAGTHHLLDRQRIGLLRDGAIVVNTGRGGLIETGALVEALESGRVGGAALDVIEGEEGVFYHDRRGQKLEHAALLRLQQLPNVIISPHTAFYTDHALRDTVQQTLENCMAFADRAQRWTG